MNPTHSPSLDAARAAKPLPLPLAMAALLEYVADFGTHIADNRVTWAREALAAAPSPSGDVLDALRGLLARSSALDQSATHDGLANCDAIAKARAALNGVPAESPALRDALDALWDIAGGEDNPQGIARRALDRAKGVHGAPAPSVPVNGELLAALLHARRLVASRDVVLDRAALKYYDAALAKAAGIELAQGEYLQPDQLAAIERAERAARA